MRRHLSRARRDGKKRKGRPICSIGRPRKKNLGGALLSRGRLPQYPRHWGPSLPSSEWDRVLPPRHGHQGKIQPKKKTPQNRENGFEAKTV